MISISIIKYGGALTRGIIENFRIVIFWAYFVIPWVDESLLERFNWLKLLGVIFTVVSLSFYFNICKHSVIINIHFLKNFSDSGSFLTKASFSASVKR